MRSVTSFHPLRRNRLRDGRAVAVGAVDDDRLVRRDLGEPLRQVGHKNVPGPEDRASGQLVAGAHVHHDGAAVTTAGGHVTSGHGGSVRTSGASRYRQWITHEFSSWHDQFGGSGCVGCGRCIAWCPVGIDVTELGRLVDPGEGR